MDIRVQLRAVHHHRPLQLRSYGLYVDKIYNSLNLLAEHGIAEELGDTAGDVQGVRSITASMLR